MSRADEMYIDFMINNDNEDNIRVKQANERVLSYFTQLTGTRKADLEDLLSYLGYEYERQGFANGIQYAVKMALAPVK